MQLDKRARAAAKSVQLCHCEERQRQSNLQDSFKHAAEAAGLGKMGWHSLLMTPGFGPRVRLACCLTEAEFETTKLDYDTECAGCGICLEICPAKALSEPEAGEPYAMNKYACCSFLSAAGGCSQCMKLCPRGR